MMHLQPMQQIMWNLFHHGESALDIESMTYSGMKFWNEPYIKIREAEIAANKVK